MTLGSAHTSSVCCDSSSPACVTGFLREDLLKFLYGDGEAIAKASWLPHEVSSRLTLCLASQRRKLAMPI